MYQKWSKMGKTLMPTKWTAMSAKMDGKMAHKPGRPALPRPVGLSTMQLQTNATSKDLQELIQDVHQRSVARGHHP
jgi:hypothetical protein